MAADTLEKAAAGLAPPYVKHRADFQAWLACASFYYPIFWIFASLVGSAHSLIRLLVFGGHLSAVRLSPFAAFLSVRASSNPGMIHARWSHAAQDWMAGLVVLLAAILVVILAGRRRPLAGLALGTLGNVALITEFPHRLFGGRETSNIHQAFIATVYLVILCWGLRWLLAGWPDFRRLQHYWGRLAILLATFVLLPLLLYASLRTLMPFFVPWKAALVFAVPPALAAAVVSAWRVKKPRGLELSGWRQAVWGISACILLFAGVNLGARALDKARTAQIRRILSAYPPVDPNTPYPKLFFQKGVNFTVEGPDGYSSSEGRRVLESLPQFGVNAVALVPYGFTRQGRTPHVGYGGWERDDQMRVAARVAHVRSMKVMLKPAIWNAIDLQFQTPQERRTWFQQYQKFLEHYARLAVEIHADIFCIGGEFTHLSAYDAEWRRLITQVRKIYPGPLVYAANFGEEFESVSFWDALDYIGLQEYYPLPDDLDASSVLEKVEAVQQKYHKPVIFTEVGFTSMEGANRGPWDDSHRQKISLKLQASCYQAIFHAFYTQPWFGGMYWWRIGSDGDGGPENSSFTPWDKPAMKVMAQWYLGGRGAGH